jgi:hypothetical protein
LIGFFRGQYLGRILITSKNNVMKRNSKSLIIKRAGFVLCTSVILSIVLLSFSVNRAVDDVWKQLGISQQTGNDNIKNSFLSGYFYHYGAEAVRNATSGNRAAAAGTLLTYVKQFVNSDGFKKEYEAQRQAKKPQVQERKTPRSADKIRKDMIDETQKALDDLTTRMKTMTPDMQKLMEPTVKSYEEMIKSYKDPKNEMFTMMATVESQLYEQNGKSDVDEMKKWEEEWPADVKPLIKKRLQKYLSISATVDFSAELKDKNGKKVFVKDEYERKSADWKMIYRAGADVNGVAKGFAEQWLKELN